MDYFDREAPADPDRDALAEIAENLHRRELGGVERAEMMARRVEISARRPAAVDLEKPAQVAPVSPKGGRGRTGGIRQAPAISACRAIRSRAPS